MNGEPPVFNRNQSSENAYQRALCRKCGIFLEPTYLFCPRCGTRRTQDEAWYYQPVMILLLGFVVIGPFALPLVWKTPKMSRMVKIGVTVALLLYSAACVYYAFAITAMLIKEFSQFDRIMPLH